MTRLMSLWITLATAGSLVAQAPTGMPVPREYLITPQAGNWAICAAYFEGEASAKMASDLVTELRTSYKLPAYLFSWGDKRRREQEEELQQRRRLEEQQLRARGVDPSQIHLPVRRVRIEDQYAVLIGGYKDMDSAHRDLDRIKKLPPPRSVPKDVLIQNAPGQDGSEKPQQRLVNPLANSFVSRNPTVNMQHRDANQPDPFLKQLNADESFSLLKCPKRWTLLIKNYEGAVVVQQQNASKGILEKLFGSHGADQLNACGENAHRMAEALRKMGYEAYVLHTRYSSMVTVGAFDSPTDPRMQQLLTRVQNTRIGAVDPHYQSEVGLFTHPRALEVPRFGS